MNALQMIRNATLAAQHRLGNDKSLSVRVLQGKAQVVRVTYKANGNPIVSPVTDWVNVSDILTTINSINGAA